MQAIYADKNVHIVDGEQIIATFSGSKEEFQALKDLTPEVDTMTSQAYCVSCGDFASILCYTTKEAALKQWEKVMEYINET